MGKSHKASKNHPQLRSRTTRSSKGRLLSDPAENNQLLTEQLRSLGLYAAPTLGDGNCLFRALSDQLYGSPSKHHQLRAAICDWIESHKTRYAPFVEDERGLDVHLRCMRENATYGGHMELSAFAHMTKRNVKVVQPGLVYVIEWASGADPTFPSSPTISDRKLRSGDRRASTSSSHSFDDEDGERSTVYVAYHDWEHFSSIRNLKGPHSGLPNVCETPAAVPASLPIAPLTPKKAREQERKEKEKERKTQKVKLKLKVSAPSPVKGPVSAVMRDVEGEEDDDEDPWVAEDPTQVPLPRSRDISCERVPSRPPLPQSSLSSSSAPNSTASTSSSSSSSSAQPQLQLQPPPRTTRSPKRSFDESSASASASDTDDRHLVERGRDKRTRRNTGAGCDVLMASPPEDADTPELSAPGSPSSSSEVSSLSRCSSAFGSPPPPPAIVEDVLPIAIASKKSKAKTQSHPMTGYERPLTRRQRKALGLPKLRPPLGSSPSPSPGMERTGSAGTIVIPGGKFKRGDGGVKVKVEEGEDEERAEWRRNGTGRVDVRGFRELKI